MGNPIIKGRKATLLWQGLSAPLLIDDIHNWDDSPQKMHRSGPKLWSFCLTLPLDAYCEYGFLDPQTGARLNDPLNPKRIWNGVNGYNHFFYMPKGKPTRLIHNGRGISRGTVTRHTIPTREYAIGAKRIVYLYHPPIKDPVPLLVVYDGSDYLHRGNLNVIVDNLIAENRIRPFAMALIQNGGTARTVEYSGSESTLAFIMECVLPFAKENLNLEPEGYHGYGIMGASLGGSMALFTALRLPQIFKKVLTQSGAFIVPDYQSIVVDLIRHFPPSDLSIWMDVGQLEWLLDGNRQMFALLEKKYRVGYHEFSGGHNYTAWRDDLANGLEMLYGSQEHLLNKPVF